MSSSPDDQDQTTRRTFLSATATAVGGSTLHSLLASVAPAQQPQSNVAEGGMVFLVQPYLQLGNEPLNLKAERLELLWHTDDVDHSWTVRVRSKGSDNFHSAKSIDWQQVKVGDVPAHRVYRTFLTELQPGQNFEYQLLCDERVVCEASGIARKSVDQPIRFVVMGDVGTNTSPQKSVAYQVYNRHPDFVFIPGDVVYENGRIPEYREKFFPIYNANHASPDTGAPLLRSTLFLAGLGEHDCGDDLDTFPDGFAYYFYWSQPLNGPICSRDSRNAFPMGGTQARRLATENAAGERYPRMANYSFDYGNVHLTVLDTWNPNIDWNDRELRDWLEMDLKSADGATWKFVSSYLPPFNSSTAFPNTQKMRIIAELLQENGVDLVFCGYAHSYQVTYPLKFRSSFTRTGPVTDPTTNIPGSFECDRSFDGKQNTTPKGVIYITTGGGGGINLHSPEQTDNRNTWQSYTAKYNASIHQFSLLEIDGKKLTFQQVDKNGSEIDRFVLTK